MFTTNKGAHCITDKQDVASFQGERTTLAADPQALSSVHAIWLHLLPGVLIVLFAIIVGPVVIRAGLPLLLIPSLWTVFILIPFELGYLLYQGKKKNGRFSLHEIVLYREPMSMRSYLLFIPALIIWAIVAFEFIAPPAQTSLFNTLFFWVPTWFVSLFATGNTAGHPQTVLLLAVVLYMLTNPAAAFVEELYFRGYLLPRMAHLKGWAPLVNTVLFCLYHLHSPWQLPGRLLAFLPIAYTVAWKKNMNVAIIVHCALDLLSASALIVLLYR